MMSTFRYPIDIGDAAQENFEGLEAWVDTEASYTLIPHAILDVLGYSPTHRRPFRLADGRVVEMGLCQVSMRIGESTLTVSCVFGDEGSEPLLGATALEEFALGVDPVHHTLVTVVLNLLSFNPEA